MKTLSREGKASRNMNPQGLFTLKALTKNLWESQLQGADFSKAQLQGADLQKAQLQEAKAETMESTVIGKQRILFQIIKKNN